MEQNLFRTELEKLSKLGRLEDFGNGQKAVRMSLQNPDRFSERSREIRKQYLADAFTGLQHNFGENDIHIDLQSLSVSGQTVEALIPVDKFEKVVRELEGRNIRVDLASDRFAY